MSESGPGKGSAFRRAIEGLLIFGAVLGSLSIWLIAIIVNYDVVMRFVGKPTMWAFEISTFLMIGAATSASGLAVIRGDHFSVDIVPAMLPPKARLVFNIVLNLVCAGLLAFVAYGFWQLIAISYKLDMKSPTLLRIPLIIPQTGVFVGFFLMALAFLYNLIPRRT